MVSLLRRGSSSENPLDDLETYLRKLEDGRSSKFEAFLKETEAEFLTDESQRNLAQNRRAGLFAAAQSHRSQEFLAKSHSRHQEFNEAMAQHKTQFREREDSRMILFTEAEAGRRQAYEKAVTKHCEQNAWHIEILESLYSSESTYKTKELATQLILKLFEEFERFLSSTHATTTGSHIKRLSILKQKGRTVSERIQAFLLIQA